MHAPFLNVRYFMGSMTNISNRPFRRLATELGAQATIGEMAIASYVVKGGSQDAALLRRDPHEKVFGAQIVGENANHLSKAARLAERLGADFVDLNCACPHASVVSHGGGARLLKQPEKIRTILETLRQAISIPLTIKIRKGYGADDNVAQQIADIAQAAHVDAIFIHGRTAAAQYRGPADWELVESVARNVDIPVIGCGDLGHGADVIEKSATSACAGFAMARGAVIKPWIFREIAEQRAIEYSAQERLELLRQLVRYTLECFGNDQRGLDKSRKFLLKQTEFLSRYVPADVYGRPLPLQERADRWTPRNELEALWAQANKASCLELLSMAGLPDEPQEKLPSSAASSDE